MPSAPSALSALLELFALVGWVIVLVSEESVKTWGFGDWVVRIILLALDT